MVVLKFGGNTLSTPEKIKLRARQIADYHSRGEKLIVVVSAMGKTTNDLENLAYEISPKPLSREVDMLLSAGERISMALLSIALNDLSCPAISFTGSQAGIMTESSHNDANILEVKPIRIEEELSKNKVVIIAGFQGVDPTTKEVTTLGRGGSDTTAIVMAHHFKASTCKMLKETAGVFTADPKLVSEAKAIEMLDFNQMYFMALGGANVVHSKAIARARKCQQNFEVCSVENHDLGTHISSTPSETGGPLAINTNHKNEITLTFAQELSPEKQKQWAKNIKEKLSIESEFKINGLNLEIKVEPTELISKIKILHHNIFET